MKVEQTVEGWKITLEWTDQDVYGPSGMHVEPVDPANPPAGGISQTVLRAVTFQHPEDLAKSGTTLRAVHLASLAKELETNGVTDLYLAMLASVYVNAVLGRHEDPYGKLTEVTGKSMSTIRGHLWQAKKRGLLESSAGRKGGKLTEKAHLLLDSTQRKRKK